MFRILCDSSSESTEWCVCVCVCVCVYGTAGWEADRTVHTHTTGSKLRCQTPTKHKTKYL